MPIIRKLELPKIEPHERTTLVDRLTEIINQQKEDIDKLIEEIKRLKKQRGKPKLRPNSLESSKDKGQENNSSQGSAQKTNHQKQPDRVEIIKVEYLPEGARFKGYRNYELQELVIKTEKILYKLERWQLPDGSYVVAKLPKEVVGFHFGPILRSYVLHQHHHQGVTQPLLLAQLREWKIEISKGQLNHLLIDDKEQFHTEKDALLPAALSVSPYIHVDDTGARHKGKNGYCTHIGNELFAWFKSTASKSRINFLEILRQDCEEYYLIQQSFTYMKKHKVAPWIISKLRLFSGRRFNDKETWQRNLKHWGVTNNNYARIVTEAALIGSVLRNGFSKDMVILSDDAGQFNIFEHALCWIHAERNIASLIPLERKQRKSVKWARSQIWDIYHLLIDYKKNPSKEFRRNIAYRFNAFCKTRTDYHDLDSVLKRFRSNKSELLKVLKHPEIPLHNNLSERDIREYVKRRKISGSTRSDDGKRCRDTFASLKKTAIKLKIGFWNYLVDRLTKKQSIPWLPYVILQTAAVNTS